MIEGERACAPFLLKFELRTYFSHAESARHRSGANRGENPPACDPRWWLERVSFSARLPRDPRRGRGRNAEPGRGVVRAGGGAGRNHRFLSDDVALCGDAAADRAGGQCVRLVEGAVLAVRESGE